MQPHYYCVEQLKLLFRSAQYFHNKLFIGYIKSMPRTVHFRNPVPGQIFNDYSHTDVYQGVYIDYSGVVSSFDS